MIQIMISTRLWVINDLLSFEVNGDDDLSKWRRSLARKYISLMRRSRGDSRSKDVLITKRNPLTRLELPPNANCSIHEVEDVKAAIVEAAKGDSPRFMCRGRTILPHSGA